MSKVPVQKGQIIPNSVPSKVTPQAEKFRESVKENDMKRSYQTPTLITPKQ